MSLLALQRERALFNERRVAVPCFHSCPERTAKLSLERGLPKGVQRRVFSCLLPHHGPLLNPTNWTFKISSNKHIRSVTGAPPVKICTRWWLYSADGALGLSDKKAFLRHADALSSSGHMSPLVTCAQTTFDQGSISRWIIHFQDDGTHSTQKPILTTLWLW